MFDPHHLKRKSRASKTGQIIQCKPTNPPMTFDLKTWELYYEWAEKNHLIPNPPTPTPTFYDSIVSTFDTSKTILQNIALQEEHEYKKLLIINNESLPPIGTLPMHYGNSLCAYVNDEPFDRAEFLLDNQYIFLYHGDNSMDTVYVQYDVDLMDFYIDVTVRPTTSITWYSNCDPGGNTQPFAISSVSPAEPIPNGSFSSWHIDYYDSPDPICVLSEVV